MDVSHPTAFQFIDLPCLCSPRNVSTSPEVRSVVTLKKIHKVLCFANVVERDHPHALTAAETLGSRVAEPVLSGAPSQEIITALVLVVPTATAAGWP